MSLTLSHSGFVSRLLLLTFQRPGYEPTTAMTQPDDHWTDCFSVYTACFYSALKDFTPIFLLQNTLLYIIDYITLKIITSNYVKLI